MSKDRSHGQIFEKRLKLRRSQRMALLIYTIRTDVLVTLWSQDLSQGVSPLTVKANLVSGTSRN